ncbi:MAG: anaerobic ribonucleoside-triphosphate reductase, partial [Lachnospiraceae bacterium]|nr:anaerobic ribonucleoside-triphosphate reductase [Lachnospiraceae bacterium]
MKIIKRSGKEVPFDGEKIVNAIEKANREVTDDKRLSDAQVQDIEVQVEKLCAGLTRAANVEEIQDMVENGLMKSGHYD